MELNLAGVGSILNSTTPNLAVNLNASPDDELDLTGVDKILSTSSKPKTKPTSDRIIFQPEISNWDLSKLNTVQDFFRQTFNRDLPVSVEGQGRIHNAWNLDHTHAADIGLSPQSEEGKKLIDYLRQNNIPFLAFNKAIPGVATSAHIHIGRASHRIVNNTTLNQTLQQDTTIDWQNKLQQEVGPIGNPIENGNLDPYHRKIYKHPNDEGYGTTYSISFEDKDGLNVLIPQIVNGKLLTKDQAIKHYYKTKEHFGKFKTWQDADKYAISLHNSQDTYLRQTRPDLYGELDLSGVDEIIQAQQQEDTPELALPNSNELNLEGIKIDPSIAVDPDKLPFKVGTHLEYKFVGDINKANRPKLGLHNPNTVGDLLSTTIDLQGARLNAVHLTPKNIQTITDAWLAAWNPEYAELNQKFRKETGGLNLALVDSPKNVQYLGDGKYKITSRPTKGVQALFEAYKKGGIPAFNATNNLINKYIEENNLTYEQSKALIEQNRAAHPYISAIKSAGQEELLSIQTLARNVLGLGKAIAIGNYYGYDSEQYLNEVNRETELGMGLEEARTSTYQPPTILGKMTKGVAGGLLAFPRFVAAGRTIGLPTMVYLENIYKGNRQAALEALPMAIMIGSMHGAGEFLAGETGTSAPFRRITQKDLSIYQDTLAKGESTTIANLSPLARQAILRGSNALAMGGSSLAANPNQSLSDLVTTLTVGLTFPVGKAPIERGFTDYKAPVPELVPKVPFQIGQRRIEIPLTSAPRYGKTNLPILEQQRNIANVQRPSGQMPDINKYGEPFDPTPFVANTETGFQARGQGETLHLDLDTAALNLLELKRALKENTVVKKGASPPENILRQKAVQDAIDHLEKVIPQDVQKFFEENEEVIRAALKTNQVARNEKANFLEKGRALAREPESIKPNEINPNISKSTDPRVQAKLDEVYKKLGDAGVNNIYTDREAAADKLDIFFKITKQGTFQSSVFGLDTLVKKSADAAYIGAFYIEDFYRRGIEPTVDLLLNKLRTSVGDFANKITEKHAIEIFQQGMNYYNSNQADPFFSRMKQNVIEELPDRFNAEQAKKVIKNTPNAFEESVAVKNLIKDKAASGERISKNELINVINEEQFRQIDKILPIDEISVEQDTQKLADPEVGIRNRITTREGFDEHRNNLVKELSQTETEINNEILSNKEAPNNIFNSGLSPDAFIDQTRLLYSGITDFAEFSSELIKRFGEQVRPFLQDLWIQTKELGKSTLKILDNGLDYLQQGKDSPAFKARQIGEGGFVGRKPKTLAGEKYKKEKKTEVDFPLIGKKLVPNAVNPFSWYSIWRSVGLAQLSTEAGEVYNVTRRGQRVKNSMESQVLFHLRDANDKVKNGGDQEVAETIWIGNEKGQLYSVAELAAGDATASRPALNVAQIGAYIDIRKAIDINLDIRRETKLYSMREKAIRLNDRLQKSTPNTPEWDSTANQLLDLTDSITKVYDHFDQLKKSGYISTQRRGKIVGYIEDANGKLYQHFDTLKEADNWVAEQINNGANPATQQIYDVRKLERLRAAAVNLTPGQFEDLIDNAGVSSHAPEIEKLRDEVYSRFPSFGYELKRDFVRGYDRNWKFALDSVAHQTETYANSFYSRVAGEEAIKKLDATGIQDTDYRMYQTLQKYIDHEIASPEQTGVSAAFGGIRKAVYLFQLGYDVNQLYLNALAQPLSQTYSYFGRVEHQGIRLSNAEVPIYFSRAGKLTAAIGRKAITGKGLVPIELEGILERLASERVVEPEFNRELLNMEAEKTVAAQLPTRNKLKRLQKLNEHWAGTFMRAGEKTTRTHAATEAWLVGKEKFNLQGEELIDFIVRAVDATQTNPTRAEAPLIIRGKQNQGEIRKLLYQFNAFNHMWLENLALNARADFRARGIRNTANHLAPLVLMGGISGLPLAGMASALYTLITGEDPKKKLFDKYLGDDTLLERLAMNGVTTSPALSRKLSPGIPLVDNIKIGSSISESVDQTLAPSNLLPAVSTGKEIMQGFSDLLEGKTLRGISELNPVFHKPIKNILTATRYQREGIKTRNRRTIVPRSRVTTSQKVLQILPGLTPSASLRYYDKQQMERIKEFRRKLKRIL